MTIATHPDGVSNTRAKRAARRFSGRRRVAHLFSRGGRELVVNPCSPRLKPWATQSAFVSRAHRAVLLLEVIVALAIMVTAMGLLSAQLVSGLRMTEHAEELTKASQLADRVLSLVELDPNTVQRFFDQREIDGDFEDKVYKQYHGWYWRATMEELPDDEELGRLRIEILHTRDPEGQGDIADAQIVRTLHLLKANPGRINLAEDFGIPEEQLETFENALAVVGQDPTSIDPQALASLDPEMLLELLPVILPLIQQFSGGKMPEGYSQDMLNNLMGADPLSGGAGDALSQSGIDPAVLDMIRSQLGGQLSEEELNGLLSNIGQGGGGGFAPGPPQGDQGGRTIDDLDRDRDEANRRFDQRRGIDRGAEGAGRGAGRGRGGRR